MFADGCSTLFLVAVIFALCYGDKCTDITNVKTLFGETWRSAAFSEADSSNAKCDAAIVEGWYRIESDAGNDTVTECVLPFRCGTHFPIWMNGSMPDVSEGIVEREMCVSHYLDCCYLSFNMSVQNCGDFRIYNLKQTSGCAMAYCFGTILITTVAPPTTSTTTTTTITTATKTTTIAAQTKEQTSENLLDGVMKKNSDFKDKEAMYLMIIIGLIVIIIGMIVLLILKRICSRRGSVTTCSSNDAWIVTSRRPVLNMRYKSSDQTAICEKGLKITEMS